MIVPLRSSKTHDSYTWDKGERHFVLLLAAGLCHINLTQLRTVHLRPFFSSLRRYLQKPFLCTKTITDKLHLVTNNTFRPLPSRLF